MLAEEPATDPAPTARTSGGAGFRYGLLETLRQYGAERLRETGEADQTRGRHLGWYLALAERAESALYGPDQNSWLERLEREHDNVRAALRWSLDDATAPAPASQLGTSPATLRASSAGHASAAPGASSATESTERSSIAPTTATAAPSSTTSAVTPDATPAELGLRLAVACSYFWQIRGHRYRSEAQRWLGQALARTVDRPSAARARAFNWAGTLAGEPVDHVRASALHRAALTLWQQLGDTAGVAESLLGLGAAARARGDALEAEQLLAESLSIARQADAALTAARALRQLAMAARASGRVEAADALAAEALASFQALGEQHQAGHAFDLIGQVASDRGDYARAVQAHDRGLALLDAAGCQEGVVDALVHLGRAEYERGDRAGALRFCAESLRLAASSASSATCRPASSCWPHSARASNRLAPLGSSAPPTLCATA